MTLYVFRRVDYLKRKESLSPVRSALPIQSLEICIFNLQIDRNGNHETNRVVQVLSTHKLLLVAVATAASLEPPCTLLPVMIIRNWK